MPQLPTLLLQPLLLLQLSLLLFQLVMLVGVVMDLALTDMVDMVILVMDMPVMDTQLTPELMPSQLPSRLKKQTINVFVTGCHFERVNFILKKYDLFLLSPISLMGGI